MGFESSTVKQNGAIFKPHLTLDIIHLMTKFDIVISKHVMNRYYVFRNC